MSSINKDIVIEKAINYVKIFCSDECSGHDYYHVMRVYKMAVRLAEAENADLFTVKLAALLHDVDDRKLSPQTYKEMINAISFMKGCGLGSKEINRICYIIREVSYKGNETENPSSIEAKCVQDADRLDAMGAIGIARIFAFGGNNNRPIYDPDIEPNMDMSADEYALSPTTSVNHFYEKIFRLKELMNTDVAREIALYREEYMREYLQTFLDEWNI